MLRNTFLHIQGVGEVTERKMWAAGVRTWDDHLASGKYPDLRRDVELSCQRFAASDWNWFDKALPGNQKWRAFGDFPDKVLYVDIETDGGMNADSITVIGTYDGSEARLFVADQNLDQARSYIEDFPVIATYNGAQFDMPMIRARFPYNFFNHIHVDLRYPLHRLGLKGGLKRVEQLVGIERSDLTQGLGGWDAVRLWNEYRRGSIEALELLLAYNEEDVRNLKPLLQLAFDSLSRQAMEPLP